MTVSDSDRFAATDHIDWPNDGFSPWHGVAALAVTTAGDAVTTALGLLFVAGAFEANPVAATVLSTVGIVPGLVVMSLVGVVAVTVVVEFGVTVAELFGVSPRGSGAIRVAGYGVAAAISALAATNNLVLLATGSPLI